MRRWSPLLAARERATRYASNATGVNGRLRAYTSNQAHSSLGEGGRNRRISAATTCALLTWTKTLPCGPMSWLAQLAADARQGWCRSLSAPPSARHPPTPWTRFRKSALSAASMASGCMSMRPCRVRRQSARSSVVFQDGLESGRQLLLQSTQVDVHQLRLRLLLRA